MVRPPGFLLLQPEKKQVLQVQNRLWHHGEKLCIRELHNARIIQKGPSSVIASATGTQKSSVPVKLQVSEAGECHYNSVDFKKMLNIKIKLIFGLCWILLNPGKHV